MAPKGKKPHKRTGALPATSAPYDPLDLKTLAASMAKVVLEQPVHPLAKVPIFEGAGVYILYYTGDYEPYRSITQKNKGRRWDQPIYVGEAARKGARKGGVLAEGPAGKVRFHRLKNHVDSIRTTQNLNVDDFYCRYLALKDFFIPLANHSSSTATLLYGTRLSMVSATRLWVPDGVVSSDD
jgi:hypothetical protein